jgi:hypothetical protein
MQSVIFELPDACPQKTESRSNSENESHDGGDGCF